MKSRLRIWLSGGLALIVALTCLLWFPTPADAIHMLITDLPGTAYTQQSFYFQSSFHLWANEAVPISHLKLTVTGDDASAYALFDTGMRDPGRTELFQVPYQRYQTGPPQ